MVFTEEDKVAMKFFGAKNFPQSNGR